MWIAFKPSNKTAMEAMYEINSKIENARCINCAKNPYLKFNSGEIIC